MQKTESKSMINGMAERPLEQNPLKRKVVGSSPTAPIMENATLAQNEAGQIKDAVLRMGDFELRSGRKSKYYLDKYALLSDPEHLEMVVQAISRKIADYETKGIKFTKIAGAELGGAILASAVSLKTKIPAVFIRNSKKGYGTQNQVEGTLFPDDIILLLEDIVTTGSQVVEAIDALESSEAEVQAIIVVIDRLEGGAEHIEQKCPGIEMQALWTIAELGIPKIEYSVEELRAAKETIAAFNRLDLRNVALKERGVEVVLDEGKIDHLKSTRTPNIDVIESIPHGERMAEKINEPTQINLIRKERTKK